MVGKGHLTLPRPVKSNHQKGPPMDAQEPNVWSAVIGAGTAIIGAVAGWFGKRNTSLLAYVYRLLAVLRRHHLESEIPEPPEGVDL